MFSERIPKFLAPKPRPYWHVDAKWICGLLLVFFLTGSLFTASLAYLTNEENGPRLAALVIGSVFIRGDERQLKADARAELAKQGGVLHPIPSMPSVTITEKDLNLSATDIKLKVFMPLTEIVYQNGVEGAATKLAKTPEEKQKFINDAYMLKFFTLSTNRALNKFSTITILVSAFLLLGVIYFSTRWGRLANPGLLLLMISLPGSLLGLIASHPSKNAANGSALGFLPSDIGQQIGNAFSHSYVKVTVVGLVLLLAAAIGRLVTAMTKKGNNKEPAEPKT